MTDSTGTAAPRGGNLFDLAIRLALLALIAYWSFLLLRPFLAILVWAAVLAVALYPCFRWLARRLGGRPTPAAFLLTGVSLAVILGPVSAIGLALVNNLTAIAGGVLDGSLTIPPPPPDIAAWPVVGEQLAAIWQTASDELAETLKSIAPQLRAAAGKLLEILGGLGLAVIQFAIAIIAAGFAYTRAPAIQDLLGRFAARAAPGVGAGFVDLAGKTVRGVARGVVGISLIQAILFGIGALVAGIPLAGLWTFLVLLMAIIQIGPAIVMLPVIIYAWSSMDTLGAIVFTLYMGPVMLLDNVLKPIVMARGLPVPMLVIFIGVIGGTFAHGLIGLFVGPIILALGYQLVHAWLAAGEEDADEPTN